MPRTYQPRPKKTYTEITEENALAEHKEFGTSVRALAEKPKVPKSTLQRRLNKSQCLLQIRYFSCLCVTLTFFMLMSSTQKPVNGFKRISID